LQKDFGIPPVVSAVKTDATQKTNILVAGAVALDLSCDYAGTKAGDIAPQAHTSNPSRISQSIGGVGHNVALAAHRASTKNKVQLCSMVGDDV
jgi:pseudouridine-5'-phosphate glycosidase/pseudouridine kinase